MCGGLIVNRLCRTTYRCSCGKLYSHVDVVRSVGEHKYNNLPLVNIKIDNKHTCKYCGFMYNHDDNLIKTVRFNQ